MSVHHSITRKAINLITCNQSLVVGPILLHCKTWNPHTQQEETYLIDCSHTVWSIPLVSLPK